MGIGEALGLAKGKVVLEYKADIEDAKIKLRELSGAQKKQAQEAITSLDDQVKAHERLAQKATLGIAAVGGAVALGIVGFKKYEESVRLGAASAGVSMDRLRQASRGLMTDMELMKFAAQGLNGRFKLTGAELENVLGAAVALERRGIMPLDQATQKLTEAMKKGEIEAFKELGVQIDENLAKTDKRKAAMKAVAELSKEAASATRSETEAIRAHGTEFRNAMDEIQMAIGQLVVAFKPIIKVAAEVTGLLASGVKLIGDAIAGIADLGGPSEEEKRERREGRDFRARMNALGPGYRFEDLPIMKNLPSGLSGAFRDAAIDVIFQNNGREAFAQLAALEDRRDRQAAAQAAQERRFREGTSAQRAVAADERKWKEIEDRIAALQAEAESLDGVEEWDPVTKRWRVVNGGRRPGAGGRRGGGDIDSRYRGLFGLGRRGQDYLRRQGIEEELLLMEAGRAANTSAPGERTIEGDGLLAPARSGMVLGKDGTPAGVAKPAGPSVLERMFGKIEEYDAYATAWGTFQNAVTSGFEAIVTGSESVGTAIKKSIAASLLAEGSQMLIQALKHGAMAIASLIPGPTFNPAAAGGHGAAAAKFLAGSVAAGIAARALGGGGGGAGAAAGAGASASGVGLGGVGFSSGGSVTRNYYIGDSFGSETPRSQASRFRQMQKGADRYRREADGGQFS